MKKNRNGQIYIISSVTANILSVLSINGSDFKSNSFGSYDDCGGKKKYNTSGFQNEEIKNEKTEINDKKVENKFGKGKINGNYFNSKEQNTESESYKKLKETKYPNKNTSGNTSGNKVPFPKYDDSKNYSTSSQKGIDNLDSQNDINDLDSQKYYSNLANNDQSSQQEEKELGQIDNKKQFENKEDNEKKFNKNKNTTKNQLDEKNTTVDQGSTNGNQGSTNGDHTGKQGTTTGGKGSTTVNNGDPNGNQGSTTEYKENNKGSLIITNKSDNTKTTEQTNLFKFCSALASGQQR